MSNLSWSRSEPMQGRGLTSPRPLPSAAPSRTSTGLPPLAAQVAIVLGVLLGTWMLLNSVHFWITGNYVHAPAALLAWTPSTAWVVFAFGVFWMVVPNVYLFRNRLGAWKVMLLLAVVSSWNLGWIAPILAAQIVLLALPATRRGLRI